MASTSSAFSAEKTSAWVTWPSSSYEVVLNKDEPIVLSPSAVSRFLRCPRQFYYQDILGLADKTVTTNLIIGNLTHRILEIFHHNATSLSADRLNKLVTTFLENYTDQGLMQTIGFSVEDIEPLQNQSALKRAQILRQLQTGFENFCTTPYFDVPFKQLLIEHNFGQIEVEGVSGIKLTGRADLIREHTDGHLEIIDFKTSRSKYTDISAEKNRRNMLNALAPIDWNLPASKRFTKREIQLPLYWLMAQYHPAFQGKKIDVTIQVIRENRFDVPGSVSFTVTHEELETGKHNLIETLEEGVVKPLFSTTKFSALGDPFQDCSSCTFNNICEKDEEDDE